MDYLLGVLVLAIGVAVSIALHEIGHLVPAKRFGVRCTQYMIGFGPTLWSWRRGETEYGIKALPFGGYVRMLGMFPPKSASAQHSSREQVFGRRPGRWSNLIEQARQDAMREVGPEDAGRLFYQRTVPQRLMIMLGGPTMNLLISVALLTLIVTGFGVFQPTTRLSTVEKCVLPATSSAPSTCSPTAPASPAAKAGLKPGDQIISFAGKPVQNWDDVHTAIRAAAGHTVDVVVLRNGEQVRLSVTPVLNPTEKLDSSGNPVIGPDGKPKTEQVGFLGVSPVYASVRQPLSSVPGLVGNVVGQTAMLVISLPQRMVGVAETIAGNRPRDPNGLVSIVGIGRVAGEMASAKGTAAAPETWVDRLVGLLSLVASLNVALFVFNMIPLLPLDGGHVAGALWEGLRRRIARLRRRPDPGPVDVARALPLAYGVASLLIGMSVLLIYADIVSPVRLGG